MYPRNQQIPYKSNAWGKKGARKLRMCGRAVTQHCIIVN